MRKISRVRSRVVRANASRVVAKKILARGEKRLAASPARAMVRPTNHTA
jgi:hypothetical protein